MVRVDYKYVTRKWRSLRRFAGLTVEASLDAIKSGKVEVARFYSGLLYFLPFAPRSLEKVLIRGLFKASRGYIMKETNYYTVTVEDIPDFEPDEKDAVLSAFKSIADMGLATISGPTSITFKPEVVNDLVRPLAPYIIDIMGEKFHPSDVESGSHAYRLVSGISSVYIMYRGNRLPKCYTLLTGLVSPVGRVEANGEVLVKHTIANDEWSEAKSNMSRLKPLKDSFEVEYFKALGVMFENRIVVNVGPIEISGLFIENAIKPAYERYYTLLRKRPRGLRS